LRTQAVQAVLGIDVGTSSTKAVLVSPDGTVLRSATRAHSVSHPRPGWAEMDGRVWTTELVDLSRELLHDGDVEVTAVGVSGMGPCVLLTDAAGEPLRPAILYGVDTRATAQIEALTEELGEEEILARCSSVLTTQAVGPKLRWVEENEPATFAAARRLYMPASWLAHQLTGRYGLDFHSASQCTPMFDTEALQWHRPWAERIAPNLELPSLQWAGDVIGPVTAEAAELTGIPAGVPVIIGTIDAWSEAVSVGAHHTGDLMLMYGTTMFLVHTVADRLITPSMWGTVGALPGTRNLAGGMATSGAVTSWLRELFGGPQYPELLAEANASGPGAQGLLMLPYFAGERTPVMDPDARGVIAGLTLSHTRGDLYRAALEATALGVRHNVETMVAAGARIERVVAVGGGTQGGLWTQIVSDVTGLSQVVPSQAIGASYGAAFLAARGQHEVTIEEWNPTAHVCEPDTALREQYDELYQLYRSLYETSRPTVHALAARQHQLAADTSADTNEEFR
jgi:xylulokinase